MLGGQPTGRGRIYKDMMDNKQHSTKLGGGHEPLKNGHPCKTFTSVSTMSVSDICVHQVHVHHLKIFTTEKYSPLKKYSALTNIRP